MISKALAISHVGSVEPYLESLTALTKSHPIAWNPQKKSKKAPFAYLAAFLEKGSQLAPKNYWKRISTLFSSLPKDLLKEDSENTKRCVQGILKALQKGTEPRTHMEGAWWCYFDIVYRLHEMQLQDGLLQKFLAPYYAVYVKGDDKLLGTSIDEWTAIGVRGLQQLGDYGASTTVSFVEEVWVHLETLVVGLAESTNTQDLEQGPLKKTADIWVKFNAKFIETIPKDAAIYSTVKATNSRVISALVTSIERENARNVVLVEFFEALSQATSDFIINDEETGRTIGKFFTERVLSMLDSPAAEHLLGGLVTYGKISDAATFQESWRPTVNALLLSSLDKERKEACIQKLMRSGARELEGKVTPCNELDAYVANKLKAALFSSDAQSWAIPRAALNSTDDVVSEGVLCKVLVGVCGILQDVHSSPRNLDNALDVLQQSAQDRLLAFIRLPEGRNVISSVLTLSGSEDEALAKRADHVIDKLVGGFYQGDVQQHQDEILAMTKAICESVRKGDIS